MNAENSEHWVRIKSLAADALELPRGQRPAFLAELEHEVEEIREAVARLVRASESLHLPASPDLLGAGGRLGRDWSGSQFGTYRVLRFLARGGMGDVYEAIQAGTGRLVALKMLALDTQFARSRFGQEGRLLGRLQHPNIAQILAADVHRAEDGLDWPYLSLELVDGVPITHYARSYVRERGALLELFLRVVHAIEYAHRQGIVHRDLKPDNVLVSVPTEESGHPGGEVKVLDFGVAAFEGELQEETRLTRAGDLIGTLAYMAPEQAAGGVVDARTDVHALGVILFELLTGRLPLELIGLPLVESLALLRESAAPLASTYDRSLRGDLDTIVATAMAKEPERRYGTAAAFADDVQRFLDQEPIAARPASRLYRARKLARRHRGLVSASLVTLLLGLATVVGTTYGLIRARAQAKHAGEVAQYLGDAFSQIQPAGLGREVLARDLLDLITADVAQRFESHPRTLIKLYRSLGMAYYGQGDWQASHRLLVRARELAKQEYPLRDEALINAELDAETIALQLNLDDAASLALFDDLLRRCAVRKGPPSVLQTRIRGFRARALDQLGRFDEAIDELNAVVLELESNPTPEGDEALGEVFSQLVNSLNRAGRYEQGLQVAIKAQRRSADMFGEASHSALFDAINLAVLHSQVGQQDEALSILEDLEPKVRAHYGAGSPTHLDVLAARSNALSELGQNERSLVDLRELAKLREQQLGPQHRTAMIDLNNLAYVLYRNGDREEAEQLATQLIERSRAVGSQALDLSCSGMGLLAALHADRADYAAAVRLLEQSHSELAELYGASHPSALQALGNLAYNRWRQGDLERAGRDYRESYELCHASDSNLRASELTSAWSLARILIELERFDEAAEMLHEVERLSALLPKNPPTPEQLAEQWAKFPG